MRRILPAMLIVLMLSSARAEAAIFEVDTTAELSDINVGNGICDIGIGSSCSLRAAIEEANAAVGSDTIRFTSIPTDINGFVTFRPQTPYDPIVNAIFIDGYTAPGFNSSNPFETPVIQIDGGQIPGAFDDALDFRIGAAGSRVRGLAIYDFPDDGIVGFSANNLVIDGCHIGVRSGQFAAGNGGDGVQLSGGSGVTIGQTFLSIAGWAGLGNVISNNGEDGIEIDFSSVDVAGNRIGTNPAGTTDMGNAGYGIRIASGANIAIGPVGTLFNGNQIVNGNVISGNDSGGIRIQDLTSNTSIYGNLIGTNATGDAAIGNTGNGIFDFADGTRIGFDGDPQFGNTISGNTINGISLGFGAGGGAASDTEILGNGIGVSLDRTTAVGNLNDGISMLGSNGILIRGNIISGNGQTGLDGSATGTGTTVIGNYIGTNVAGTDLGNGADGVRPYIGWQVGSTTPGQGNVIAFSGDDGVNVLSNSATGASIRGNAMYANGGLGIDLWTGGREPNDVGDGDTGTNNLQNFPVFDAPFTLYNDILDQIEIRYRVDTNIGNATYPFAIDFYLADAAAVNGEIWLGEDSYPQVSAGSFRTVAFPRPEGLVLLVGDQLVATATDDDGNTSEISDPIGFVPEPTGGLAIGLLCAALLGDLRSRAKESLRS